MTQLDTRSTRIATHARRATHARGNGSFIPNRCAHDCFEVSTTTRDRIRIGTVASVKSRAYKNAIDLEFVSVLESILFQDTVALRVISIIEEESAS